MRNKPHFEESYNENDARAKKALRDYLDSKGIPTVVHEDYGPDIKASLEVFYEVEIKKGWEGDWNENWDTVRIPARKKRLMKNGRRVVFWVMNNDCTQAFRVYSSEMKDEYIKPVPNKFVPEGELFYCLPVEVGAFISLEQ